MTLRRKTILIILATVILLVAALFAVSQRVLMGQFLSLEDKDMQQNLERALQSLASEFSHLSATCGDWAYWDDTYKFIRDHNEDYVAANLSTESLATIQLNFQIFIDADGKIVSAKAVDFVEGEPMEMPKGIDRYLYGEGSLTDHKTPESVRSGIVMSESGAILVSSRAILTSNRQGPIRGTLVVGRCLDSRRLKTLSETVQLPIEVLPLGELADTPDFSRGQHTARCFGELADRPDFSRAQHTARCFDAPIVLRRVDGNTISGYAQLADVWGKPALAVSVSMPRAIYGQGRVTLRYMAVAIVASGAVFGLVTVLLLEKMIVSRIRWLGGEVSRIGEGGNPSMRVAAYGRDELGGLAGEINATLDKLEHSEAAVARAEARFRHLVDATGDWIWSVDENCVYTYASPRVADILGYSPGEVVGRTPFDFMPPGEAQRTRAEFTAVAEGRKPLSFLENAALHKDGRRVVLETSGMPLFDEKGVFKGYWGSDRDITKRKKFEEALKTQTDVLENIMSNIPHFIFWKDRNSVYLGCNDSFAKAAGVGHRADIVGKTDYDLAWKKEEADFYRQCDRQAMDAGEAMIDIEETARTADGREIAILTSKVPLRDPEGRVVGILGMYADVTEQRNTRDRLAKALEEMRRFNQLATGRELRMVELKREVNEMAVRAGMPRPYDLSFTEDATGSGPVAS